MSSYREMLREIRTFPQLIRFLRDELDWPITSKDFEELTFEYTAEELGIERETAAKIQEIKRLRPLVPSQPWGIFFVKFEPKKLPVVALRRILSRVVLKKRASANSAERAAWQAEDLLFISNYGEGDERRISLAHFSQDGQRNDLPILRVLGWDNLDTPLHLDNVAEKLTSNLKWPDESEDIELWRKTWEGAFTLRHREVITTSRDLSSRLAELARDIRDRIRTTLAIETETGPLTQLMKAFQEALIHDLDADGFADMYAQTIAYGLLSARIADPKSRTTEDFASHMRTNPFLRELMETFLQVGGRRARTGEASIDFDELGVSEVVELLDDAKMEAVLRDFGDRNPQEDPVIHFYEHFLAAYDKKQKVQRGVFYTPRPAVSYIVRCIDELLRTEFGLKDGLADTTTWGEMVKQHSDLQIPDGISPDHPFVQILDPACGTGTFLVEVIDLIHKTVVENWKAQKCEEKRIQELWNDYVPKYLLPRLHGYELLMAPYAIAHLKMGLKLYETGYRFGSDERARVYLTNALESASDKQLRLTFFPALAHEAQAVNEIKRKQCITVVIGNPPYAQYSMNLNETAKMHIEKFRFANGRRIRARNALQLERNLNDDYVKFLGFSSEIFPPGTGVLGMITNRMYLDSESLVGLREWMCTNFEYLWVVDLWGSSEESRRIAWLADDENVFDILQGVAIFFGVCRRSRPGDPNLVHSREVIGKRKDKYSLLAENLEFNRAGWQENLPRPEAWWLHRDHSGSEATKPELTLAEIFPHYSTLVASNRDHLVVNFDADVVLRNVRAVQSFKGSHGELAERFRITLKKGWNVASAREKLSAIHDISAYVQPIEYRPFDRRWIFFHPTLVWQTAPVCSENLLNRPFNRVLISLGKNRAETTNGQWVTATLADKSVVSTRDNASGFPLYLYDYEDKPSLTDNAVRPNLSPEFLRELAASLDLPQVGNFGLPQGLTPEDILHYIYAVLYSPAYRSRYADMVKLGFPPVPLPGSLYLFHDLACLGSELVLVHLMESPKLANFITAYAGPRNPEVGRVGWSDETVWLDAAGTNAQEGHRATKPGMIGFRGVPERIWAFHIGGYQVCHKWLKDRKGRRLTEDDLSHYQKIIVALSETIRIMREIDEAIETHGGWPNAFQAGGIEKT